MARPTPDEVAARASAVAAACIAANQARTDSDKHTAHLHAEWVAAAIIADAINKCAERLDDNGDQESMSLSRIDDRLAEIRDRIDP